MIKKESLIIFLKGIFMGAADVVPGVSGGTIALIVGIYERLINAIKGVNINFIFSIFGYYFKGKKRNLEKARKEFFSIDFPLFIPLGLGIVIAIICGALIIPYLLHNHPAYIFAFFFGLIIGSIKFVYKKIDNHKIPEYLILFSALVFSFWFTGLEGVSANHSYTAIFFSGMIAICAMLLPGISGSFMLLFLGQYEFMLGVIRNLSEKYLYSITFGVGCVIGILGFSRIISYLLRTHHSKTMAFLVGLMLGSLRIPFSNVFFVKDLYPEIGFVWNFFSIFLVLFLAVLGVFTVLRLEKFSS